MLGAGTRPGNIFYSGVGLEGALVEREAPLQHEIDDLNGTFYRVRVVDLCLLAFSEKIGRSFDTLTKAADNRAEDGE